MAGLRSMIADPHLELFTEMKRLVDEPKRRGKRYRAGYGGHDPAVKDLDKRFAALEHEEPIAPRLKMWLKSLRKVKVVPRRGAQRQPAARSASQSCSIRSGAPKRMRAREARERSDPAFTTARALCEHGWRAVHWPASARRLAALREHWPDGPDRQAHGAQCRAPITGYARRCCMRKAAC